MKKLLIVLMCLPLFGFSQNYTHKMDSILTYGNNQLGQKTEFTYDANNNNTLCLIYRDSILTLQAKIENTYDINNNLILMKSYDWDDILSVWQGDDKNEYTYDINNNLILEENFDWGATFWQIHGRVEFTYDINNNLILRERYSWDYTLSSLQINSMSELTYDINNNLILREDYYWDDVLLAWEITDKGEYTYDVNNNLTMIIQSDFDLQSSWLFNGKWEYVYDTNGNMITSTYYQWNGVSWVYYISNNFTYDLSLLTDNIAYPFSRSEFVSEYEKIYYNPISTSDNDGYYTFHYSPIAVTGVVNLNLNFRELKNVVDVLGRETKPKSNTPLFYIFDDGIVEKRIIIE
jgi:hypothetical protein